MTKDNNDMPGWEIKLAKRIGVYHWRHCRGTKLSISDLTNQFVAKLIASHYEAASDKRVKELEAKPALDVEKMKAKFEGMSTAFNCECRANASLRKQLEEANEHVVELNKSKSSLRGEINRLRAFILEIADCCKTLGCSDTEFTDSLEKDCRTILKPETEADNET